MAVQSVQDSSSFSPSPILDFGDTGGEVYQTGYTLGVQVAEPSTNTAETQNLWLLLLGLGILWLMGSKSKSAGKG